MSLTCTMLSLRASVAAGLLTIGSASFGQADCPAPAPPAGHASLQIFTQAYFESVPQWKNLGPAERDLLIRVSLSQRNRKAADSSLRFQAEAPPELTPLQKSSRRGSMRRNAAGALDRMLVDGRLALRQTAGAFYFDVGDTHRSFEEQKTNWSINLARYMAENRKKLNPFLDASGRYGDAAVCRLRTYASSRYAFPGYSNHQQGLAVDLHVREGQGPLLIGTTKQTPVGTTGLTNTQLWCRTAVFEWLKVHAREYGFVQAPINEPWHWEYHPELAKDAVRAAMVAPSCQTK